MQKTNNRIIKKLNIKNIMFSAINAISFSTPETYEEEEVINGVKVISWGRSTYGTDFHTLNPEFYSEISSKTPTLSSIISKRQDFAMGRGDLGEKNDLIFKLLKDIQVFGGCALQVGWNGVEYESNYISISNLRWDIGQDKFVYYPDWKKQEKNKFRVFNKFDNSKSTEIQILIYKEPNNNVYPTPMYEAALVDCNTQIRIQDFNNQTVANNFNVSGYITIPSANATDEEINTVEENLAQKFSGNKNAAKFFSIFYDPDSTGGAKPELQRLQADKGFVDQYTTIEANTKATIYQTMKAIPTLFGDITQSTGFNSQEFKEAWAEEKKYIKRLQNIIINLFSKVNIEIEFEDFISEEEQAFDSVETINILTNESLTVTQKRMILEKVSKFTEEELDILLAENEKNNNESQIQ